MPAAVRLAKNVRGLINVQDGLWRLHSYKRITKALWLGANVKHVATFSADKYFY